MLTYTTIYASLVTVVAFVGSCSSPTFMILGIVSIYGCLILLSLWTYEDSWPFMILYILILGGVVVTMAILSSVDLNQKLIFKTSLFILIFSLFLALSFLSDICSLSTPIPGASMATSTKMVWVYFREYFIIFATLILLLYFSLMFSLTKNLETPLRKHFC